MSGSVDIAAAAGTLWPYVCLVLVGAIPTETWRILAVLLARGVNDASPVFVWVRYVATALLAGVVAKLVGSPSGALVAVSTFGRVSSLLAAFGAFFLFRRHTILAVAVGESVLIAFAMIG